MHCCHFRKQTFAWLIAAVFSCLPLTVQADQTHAFFAKSIWLGAGEQGSQRIEGGVLLTRNGRVAQVGTVESVQIPADAIRHDLRDSVLIPGLVVAQSNVLQSTTSDEAAISPELSAVDAFDPFDDYKALLAGGVTSLQVSPPGNRLMPGKTGVVRLTDGTAEHVLKSVEGLQVVLTAAGLNPPTVYQPPVGAVSVDRPVVPTQRQLATSLSQAVVGLEALFESAREALAGDAEGDIVVNALGAAVRDSVPIRWIVSSKAEVQAALQLSTSFELPWVMIDPEDVDLLSSPDLWDGQLAKGVMLNPELRPGRISNPAVPGRRESKPTPVWERAHRLVEAGIGHRLAVYADNDDDIPDLLFSAAVFGRAGFDRSQILQMLTYNPSVILGVEDQVGSLTPGAHADFVVLSSSPLDAGTTVQATYVGGQLAYEPTKQMEEDAQSASVILAGKIYTPDGILESSKMTVVDGAIRSIGSTVSMPAHARVKDFGNATIVPGMIDCGTTLGIGGSLSAQISLGTKLGDLLARNDRQIAEARKGGVTTALLSSSRLPSPVVAYKLLDEPRAVKDPVAIRFEIDGNLTAAEASLRRTLQTGKAYADSWSKYERDFEAYEKKLAEYEKAKKEYDAALAEAKKKEEQTKDESKDGDEIDPDKNGKDDKPSDAKSQKPSIDPANKREAPEPENEAKNGENGQEETEVDKAEEAKTKDEEAKPSEPKKPEEPKKPRFNEASEPYRPLFAKKIVALVELSEVGAVDLAVKLFRKEFELKTGIVAGEAAAKKAKELQDADVFVVVGPELVDVSDGVVKNHTATLALEGVSFGFQSSATTGMQLLPSAVSYAVFRGLGRDAAVAGLTEYPVEFFGLQNFGGIEVGNDADLVVLSGSPLDLSSEVLAVMIDGRWVYEK